MAATTFHGAHDPVRDRAFRRARRHTRHVRLLRGLLPALTVAAGGLYFWQPGLSLSVGAGVAKVESIEITSDALKMLNPSYEGYTTDQGRYVVTAASAAQTPGDKDTVDLERITATLKQLDGQTALLRAPSGRFHMAAENLKLAGKITLDDSTGLKAVLQSADILVKDRRITTDKSVDVAMPNGTVRAETMVLLMSERRITFSDNVRTHLDPPKSEGNAAVSSPVAKGRLGAMAENDQPIDIRSDALEVRDNDKTALFTGSVEVRQGDMRLTTPRLNVLYAGSALKRTSTTEATDVRRIEATEGVEIAMADGRRATGAWCTIDRASNRVELGGGVTLLQAGSRLKGETLEMDLTTGKSRFLPGGRVRGHFAPGDATAEAAPEASKKSKGQAPDLARSLSSLSKSGGGVTDIEANTLDFDDRANLANFRGDVVVLRDKHQLKAQTLIATFAPAAAGAQSAGGQMSKIEARTDVVLTTPDNQVSRSDWLIYDEKGQTVTIGGNVVVSQDTNVIKGERLVVDLKTGKSRFQLAEGQDKATTGRVRMLITQGKKLVQSAKKSAVEGDQKAKAAASGQTGTE